MKALKKNTGFCIVAFKRFSAIGNLDTETRVFQPSMDKVTVLLSASASRAPEGN